MATRTISTVGGNWDSTLTWVEGVVPTSADDVVATALSGNLTINVAAACRSIDLTGYVGTLTHNSAIVLTVGDASGGALKFVAGMTYTNGTPATSQIHFVSTSNNGGAGWGVTTAGKTMGGLVFNGAGGKWVLQDALTITSTSATVQLTAGTLDTNGQSVSCGLFSSSNSNTRTLTLGSSSITLTGTGSAWSTGTTTNLTVTANTATVTMSGTSATFSSSGFNWNGMSLVSTGSGAFVLNASGTHTFGNLTRTGTAAKTDTLSIAGAVTVTDTFTVNGNSTTNRLLVQSGTVGTARTVTAATVTVTNADLMDITGAGAGSWDLSAISGGSGDAGGNSGITFTTAVSRYAVVAGNWSATATWSATSGGAGGSSVPLPQDGVVLDANSAAGTYTADMPRIGKSVDFTGFTRTFAGNIGVFTLYGSLTFASGMTITGSNSCTLAGRGTHTLTAAGHTHDRSFFFSGPGGTYTLQDALTQTAALRSIIVTDGTWTTNDQSITTATFTATSNRSLILNLGSSVVSLTSTSTATIWTTLANQTQLNPGTSEIVVAAASANTRTISWTGLRTDQQPQSLNTVTYTVAASSGVLQLGTTVVTYPRTLNTLNIGPAHAWRIFAGSTLHVLNLNIDGTSGNLVTLDSTTAGTAATLAQQYQDSQGNIWSFVGNAKATDGYLALDGVVGTYASAPDSAALSITGDIDIRVSAAADDWTPAAVQVLLAKATTSGNRSLRLDLQADGALALNLSQAGVSFTTAVSSVSTGLTNGAWKWLRVTWRASDGRVQFFLSDDGVTWTQLGTDQTIALASIFDSTVPLEIGSVNSGTSPFAGKIGWFEVRDGIDGTVVAAPDFTACQINQHEFLSIKDSTAVGYGSWWAEESTNVSGNTNWNFGAAVCGQTASGTGTANDPTVQISTSVSAATGAGAAETPSPSLAASTTAAAGAAAAAGVTATLATTGNPGESTGAAGGPTSSVSSTPTTATATGTAPDATVDTAVVTQAAAAAGAGAANNATTPLTTTAGSATAAGAAQQSTTSLATTGIAGESTGAAGGPTSTVSTSPTTAAGTGASLDPVVSTTVVATATAATATGSGLAPSAALGSSAGSGQSSGAAQGPAAATAPASTLALGAGVANNAAVVAVSALVVGFLRVRATAAALRTGVTSAGLRTVVASGSLTTTVRGDS